MEMVLGLARNRAKLAILQLQLLDFSAIRERACLQAATWCTDSSTA
jgi:hypothetical protein